MRAFAQAAAALLALGGCHRQVADDAPPRAHDAIAIPPQTSVIAVPVTADISELSAALERAVPRTLWTIDQPGQVCAAPRKVKVLFVKVKTPTIKCRLVGTVTRGPLAIAGVGQTIVVTMPIHATIRARDIGGIVKQETATASAQVRAIVRLDLNPDWSPRGSVDIAYDWTEPPHIDILGKHLVLTDKADTKLKGVIARLEQTLPRELAKLRFRQQVQAAWASGFTSLELNHANPPVWMRITPKELNYGGYSVAGRKLVLRLGMNAQTETFVGPRPADPPATPLPPLRRLDAPAGRILFAIPVVADYAQLEPVILKALVKRSARPFDVPGLGAIDARFEKVTAYGTDGGRIAVGLQFSAATLTKKPAHGTVWLTALPLNPANTRVVNFTDLKVTGITDSTGTNLLLKLANAPALSSTISEALAQNFAHDYDELLGKIGRAIDQKQQGDFVIRARIDDITTGSLKAAGQGLYLPVWGKGTASITLGH